VLIFGTIGLAYVRSEFTAVGDVPSPATRDVNAFGIVSGFGAEVALASNWSLRGEYLYYAVNHREDITTLTSESAGSDFVKIDGIHVARIAANYRFNASQAAMAAPAVNWSGVYIGAHAGYGRSRITGIYDTADDHGSFDIDPRGFLGGGQIGFNWQNGAWVYGIEADGSWSGMDDDRVDTDGDTQTLKTTSLFSLRGRVGIAASDRLYYVTAGWGHGRSKLDVVESGVPASVSFNANGAVIGSGTEWAFAPNWSARLEGLTYLFDKRVAIPTLTTDSGAEDFVRQSTVNVIRVGLNYRFGSP
jgi:outer membrane immunogenic protein